MQETVRIPGGYTWAVILRDGTKIVEVKDGVQRSIAMCHEMDVGHIVLTPTTDRHQEIVVEVQPGQSWRKFWTHTFTIVDDLQPGQVTVDVLELQGVRMYIYPDGTIRMTTHPEC